MSFGQRVRTLFRLFLLLTFLVAVALISAITTIRLTIHGRQQTMPNLVGVALASAEEAELHWLVAKSGFAQALFAGREGK